jgi:hypothetical protein
VHVHYAVAGLLNREQKHLQRLLRLRSLQDKLAVAL